MYTGLHTGAKEGKAERETDILDKLSTELHKYPHKIDETVQWIVEPVQRKVRIFSRFPHCKACKDLLTYSQMAELVYRLLQAEAQNGTKARITRGLKEEKENNHEKDLSS